MDLHVATLCMYAAVTIGFTSTSYSIEESAGSVTFIVSVLTGTLSRLVEVGFSTDDGSATGLLPRKTLCV